MTLYLPVGPPACGKTHLLNWCVRYGVIDPYAVVSTDDLRIKLTGNVWDQTANNTVFAIVDRMVSERMKRGLDVWHDATNLLESWRESAVRNQTCRDRNSERNPPIPDNVMDTMFGHRATIERQRLPGRVMTDVAFRRDALLDRENLSRSMHYDLFT